MLTGVGRVEWYPGWRGWRDGQQKVGPALLCTAPSCHSCRQTWLPRGRMCGEGTGWVVSPGR